MNGIEQIRESRKDGYWGSPIDAYECPEAERHVDYLLAEVDRLHEKLVHIERLEREAAAAAIIRAVQWDADGDIVIHLAGAKYGWDTNEPINEPLIVELVALKDALAAYRAQEG